jgi:hypothetical protein
MIVVLKSENRAGGNSARGEGNEPEWIKRVLDVHERVKKERERFEESRLE